MLRFRSRGLWLAVLFAAAGSVAAATPQMKLEIKKRAFVPAELAVPAGVKIKLVIHNADTIPAEFESYDLSREVVVPGGGKAVIYIGPLDKGRYAFFNDFYPKSKGFITAQ